MSILDVFSGIFRRLHLDFGHKNLFKDLLIEEIPDQQKS